MRNALYLATARLCGVPARKYAVAPEGGGVQDYGRGVYGEAVGVVRVVFAAVGVQVVGDAVR